MTSIHINHKSHLIELTKKFDKAASRYGTEEYVSLQNVRRDYPSYRIVVKSFTSKNKPNYKGLSYQFMEEYIKKNDDDGTILAQFKALRATSEEAIEMRMESLPYYEIKDWFVKTYPAISDFQTQREKILSKAA